MYFDPGEVGGPALLSPGESGKKMDPMGDQDNQDVLKDQNHKKPRHTGEDEGI